MENGLKEINKQVNELNAAANEKVEVNCEKACNARYNALVDKLFRAKLGAEGRAQRLYNLVARKARAVC